MLNNQRGIAHVLVIALIVFALAGLGFLTYKNLSKAPGWEWSGESWQSSGNAPKCDDSLTVQSPTDVSKASSILYPGQTRGGNYKSHGGFRFEQADNAVEVVAPLDAKVVEGSRYIEQGETQYYFIFIHDCGIAYRLDHLLTLTPEFQNIADSLPAAKKDDSRTTRLDEPVEIKAGELIATEVGFKKNNNVSFDFGLYDLRRENGFTLSGEQSDPNSKQFNAYGLCWFDSLNDKDSAAVRSLPAADAASGKTSDYCK